MADEDQHPTTLTPEVKWSEIPDDILLKIGETLTIYSDYIRLRAVCLQWRITLPPTPPRSLPPQLPWLLLPPSVTPLWSNTNNNNFSVAAAATSHRRRRTFYNISTNKLHSFDFPVSLYPRRIVGSCHGFLIIASESPEIFCFNPITKKRVLLPHLNSLPAVISFRFSDVGREYLMLDKSTGRDYVLGLKQMRDDHIRKIVLSSSPSGFDTSFAFAVTTSLLTQTAELVCCAVGHDDRWVSVPVSDFAAEDVVYCRDQGLFYAVSHSGDVRSFCVYVGGGGGGGGGGICDAVGVWRTASVMTGDLKYLVLHDGELMLLTRQLSSEADVIIYCELNKTVGFEVYRFSECAPGEVRWDPVKELGDGVAVFVGESSSVAMSASDFPGCRGNCIYFTDDHSKCNDVGVFDLEGRCVEALPCFPEYMSLPLSWESPIWITPNPS